MEVLSFEQCCNLKVGDVRAFLEILACERRGTSALLGLWEDDAVLCSAQRSEAPGTTVLSLCIKSCKQLSLVDLQQIRKLVADVDVNVCACGRMSKLSKCSRSQCQGICELCGEIVRSCGLACGACSQPQNTWQVRLQICF